MDKINESIRLMFAQCEAIADLFNNHFDEIKNMTDDEFVQEVQEKSQDVYREKVKSNKMF